MGVLGQSRDKGAAGVTAPLQAPVDRTGFFQNVGAGFNQAVAGPHSTQNATSIYQSRAYDQIVSALNAEGERATDLIESPVKAGSPFYHPVEGEQQLPDGRLLIPVQRPYANPFSEGQSFTRDVNPLMNYYGGGDQSEVGQVWAGIQKVRQRKPDFLKQFPDQASLSAWADQQRQRDLAAAQSVTSRAGTMGSVGGFIGNMAGSVASLDPENAVGGFGTAAGKTVARTVIKRAVEGAGANAAASLLATPGQMADANHLGQPMTAEDVAHQTLKAAGIGAVFGGAHVLIPKVPEVIADTARAAVDKAATVPVVRDALVARSIAAGTIQDHSLLNDWQRTHNPGGIVDTSTPDERAAANVIVRDATAKEMSPLHPQAAPQNDHRLDALAQSLGVKLTDMPSTAPVQTPTVRDQSAGSSPRRPASFSEAINRAEGSTRNPRSTADGYGNFRESTWLSVAPKVTDTAGMSRDQILALRHDKAIAAKATNYYAAQNASYLHARGIEDSPGNLSLAHFLGPEGAAKVLTADPTAFVEGLLPAKVVEANHEVLRGKSASEVIAWAHKRIGASVDQPPARPDAVPEGADYSDIPYERATFRPEDLQTDAALMQYKSGGDTNGVTGKLKDVTEWNPLMSSELLAWQANDGRNVVVDGHQRLGLAQKLASEGQSIELPSLVVKEADGITAAQARVLGALRNINLGTGSLVDNARVLRDVPDAAEILKGAENRREIEGLSRLSYEAFGAAANEVIDPRIAAEVGKYAPDSSTHLPLLGLLAKERITNPREAGHIVRQAVADGFGQRQDHQLSLLGDEPKQSLYVPIARILDASAKKLREEKRTFKVLSEKAGKIEEAGNVLDRTANKGKVIGSDEALAILNATAHRAGPVRDALVAAARAELSGSRRADAVNGFLDALAGIDLRTAARGAEEHGIAGEPSGAEGSRDAASPPDEELPRSNGSLFDQAVAARDKAEPFSDPVGEGAKAQTDLIEHDLRMDAEPEKGLASGVYYHGSPIKGLAKITSEAEQGKKEGNIGIYFSGDAKYARRYAFRGAEGEVYAARLRFEKPLVIDAPKGLEGMERVIAKLFPSKMQEAAKRAAKEFAEASHKSAYIFPHYLEELRSQGYDAIVNHATDEVVVFSSKQIMPAAEAGDVFDAGRTPSYRLSDEGEPQSLKDILDQADADEAAAQALRDCLK